MHVRLCAASSPRFSATSAMRKLKSGVCWTTKSGDELRAGSDEPGAVGISGREALSESRRYLFSTRAPFPRMSQLVIVGGKGQVIQDERPTRVKQPSARDLILRSPINVLGKQ